MTALDFVSSLTLKVHQEGITAHPDISCSLKTKVFVISSHVTDEAPAVLPVVFALIRSLQESL